MTIGLLPMGKNATRREFLAGLAAAGLLVAADTRAVATQAATRIVISDNGPVEVPVAPSGWLRRSARSRPTWLRSA